LFTKPAATLSQGQP